MKKTALAALLGCAFMTAANAANKPGLPAQPVSRPAPAVSASLPSAPAHLVAHEVPAIQPLPPTNAQTQWENLVAAPPQAKMSFRTRAQAENALTAAYDAGRINSLPPIAGDDGAILYPYGQSWPTVVCSPLHVCVIQLGKGDKPSQVVLGQPGMWQLTQAMAGDTPLLALSPRFKGLHTNLMVTATSATGKPRVYYVNLVSDNDNYVPKVGFYFPDAISTAWKEQAQMAARAQQIAQSKAKSAAHQTVAALPALSVAAMDFDWTETCASHSSHWFSRAPSCDDIKPIRVFDDGVHTYLQMPAGLSNTVGLPTIMASNTAGQPAILNFRFKGGYYVVDGVPSKLLLVAGNGDGANQKIVEITHTVK